MSLHVNHRRKIKYRNERPRWYTRLKEYRQAYWGRERARQRFFMCHARYDELQNKHPDSVLWDAL